MDIQTAKQIRIADYLHSLGYSPVKQQGVNLWYKSPLREEAEASFKVNTEREQWYDFGLGKGGGIIELAAPEQFGYAQYSVHIFSFCVCNGLWLRFRLTGSVLT